MKKMFKVLLFPIWLVLEVVVFVLKLVMVLSSTVLGILLRILVPMAFVALLLSVRNGLMLLAFAWLISPIGLPWVADRVVFGLDDLCCAVKGGSENNRDGKSGKLVREEVVSFEKTNGFFFDLKRRNDWQQHD